MPPPQVAEFAAQNFDFYGDTLLQNLADVVDRDQYWTSLTVDPSSGADFPRMRGS